MLTYFQNSFTVRLSGKFAIEPYLNIPPHLSMSVHYLVKNLCSENRHAQEVIEANCRVRLSHPKLLKHLSGK